MQTCACGQIVGKNHLNAAVRRIAGDQHPIALHTAERSGRQIGDHNNIMADQLLRGIMLCDAGNDGSFTLSVIQRNFQKLLCALDRLTCNDFCNAQLHLVKFFDCDLRLLFF